MSYSDNESVQILAYGAVNPDLDDGTDKARRIATTLINVELGYTADISAPLQAITDCATHIAAAYLTLAPGSLLKDNVWYLAGMDMLQKIKTVVGSGRTITKKNYATSPLSDE